MSERIRSALFFLMVLFSFFASAQYVKEDTTLVKKQPNFDFYTVPTSLFYWFMPNFTIGSNYRFAKNYEIGGEFGLGFTRREPDTSFFRLGNSLRTQVFLRRYITEELLAGIMVGWSRVQGKQNFTYLAEIDGIPGDFFYNSVETYTRNFIPVMAEFSWRVFYGNESIYLMVSLGGGLQTSLHSFNPSNPYNYNLIARLGGDDIYNSNTVYPMVNFRVTVGLTSLLKE